MLAHGKAGRVPGAAGGTTAGAVIVAMAGPNSATHSTRDAQHARRTARDRA